MKNIIIIIGLTFYSTSALAQRPVLEGKNILNERAENSLYVVFNQDEKDLKEDVKSFFNKYGKVDETNKHTSRVKKVKILLISEKLDNIDVTFEESKRVLRVAFFLLDYKGNSLEENTYNLDAAKNIISEFTEYSDLRLSRELAENNLKMVSSNFDNAEKEVKKIEKRLSSNLRDQENYGKKLDASPDMLAQSMAEKEELIDKLYNDSTSTNLDIKAVESLKKESSKKDKEIAKIRKNKSRNSSKLEKKEIEFDGLKDELFAAKKVLSNLLTVKLDAEKAYITIKK